MLAEWVLKAISRETSCADSESGINHPEVIMSIDNYSASSRDLLDVGQVSGYFVRSSLNEMNSAFRSPLIDSREWVLLDPSGRGVLES